MYSPAGVEVKVLPGMGIFTGAPVGVVPSNLLTPRGTAVFPTTFHKVPSLVITIRPFALAVIRLGVISAAFELKGTGGKLTRSTTCILSGSTMLIVSPPELATYRVRPSDVRASELGSWP